MKILSHKTWESWVRKTKVVPGAAPGARFAIIRSRDTPSATLEVLGQGNMKILGQKNMKILGQKNMEVLSQKLTYTGAMDGSTTRIPSFDVSKLIFESINSPKIARTQKINYNFRTPCTFILCDAHLQ